MKRARRANGRTGFILGRQILNDEVANALKRGLADRDLAVSPTLNTVVIDSPSASRSAMKGIQWHGVRSMALVNATNVDQQVFESWRLADLDGLVLDRTSWAEHVGFDKTTLPADRMDCVE